MINILTIYIITILLYALLIFLLFRSAYTFTKSIEALEIITKYINNKHIIDFSSYNKMQYDYYEYLFSFWKWGKYSIIKPEYRDILKSYM